VSVTVQLPKKLQFLFEPMRYKVAYGGRGCLAPGTQVIMADGSLANIEDVRVGDKMMGPDSKPREVLDLFHGTEMMYAVKQTSAQEYIVNGAHVLVLKKSESCKADTGEVFASGRPRRPNGRYPSHADEVELTVEEWFEKSQRWKDNFRGFRAGLIKFKRRKVTVDPYLLGLWLGDGLHRELLITSADEEIREWLRQFATTNGLRYTQSAKSGKSNRAVDVRLGRDPAVHGRKNPVWQEFKRYNVVSNKHIPEDFIANSEEVRLKLLAGLIDTDGTYARGGYSITSASERLAYDIKRLADTLGFRTTIRKRITSCGDFRGVAWNIGINGSTGRIPCILPRKKATVAPNKDKMLSMIDIEPVGEGEYYGVLLDGDHRFLLADGTVTHNSGKSWTFARALLLLGASKKLRILCAREVQKSIKKSVHQLLADQVELLGLSGFYNVLDTEIVGNNGTQFSFSGLLDHTIDSIKSFEGCDIVWIEEAHSVSKRSWDILVPTIRKEGSEIWATFNPELDTDEAYRRFVLNTPPNAIAQLVNYSDNPWFTGVLDLERQYCEANSPEDYPTIWLGQCRSAVIGAIYAAEMDKTIREQRIAFAPYDPTLKVHTVWDLGWNDSMAIAMVQKMRSELRIIDTLQGDHKTLDWYVSELRERRYNWAHDYLPHDGFHGDFKTGKTTAQLLQAMGRKVRETPNVGVENGIKMARMLFPRTVFNKPLTEQLIESLKRYKRRRNTATGEFEAPLHDANSHFADVFRYIAVNEASFTNEDEEHYYPEERAFTSSVPGMSY